MVTSEAAGPKAGGSSHCCGGRSHFGRGSTPDIALIQNVRDRRNYGASGGLKKRGERSGLDRGSGEN